MEFVSIEELVHRGHLLRKIDRVIDFEFILEKLKDLYCTDKSVDASTFRQKRRRYFASNTQGLDE